MSVYQARSLSFAMAGTSGKIFWVLTISTCIIAQAFRTTADIRGKSCCCATLNPEACAKKRYFYHPSTQLCCGLSMFCMSYTTMTSTTPCKGHENDITAVADWSAKAWMHALYFSFSAQSSNFRWPADPVALRKLGLALPIDARILGISGGDCAYTRTLLQHVKAAGATQATVVCTDFSPKKYKFPSNVTQVQINNSNTHDSIMHLRDFASANARQFNIIVANYNTCACYGSTSCAAIHLHNDENDVSGLHQFLTNLELLAHPTKSAILVAPVSFHDYKTGKRLITAAPFQDRGWNIEASTKRESTTFGYNFLKWRWTDRSSRD